MIWDFPTTGGIVDDNITLPQQEETPAEGEATGADESGVSDPQYILKDEDGNEVKFFTMLEMSVSAPTQLPSEVIEKGAFAVYNRVIEPMTFSAMLMMEGEEYEIQDALNALDELKNGEKKLEFITPFETYENLMVESYDYRRDDHSGHNTLRVEVRLKEIREVEVGKTTKAVTEPEPIQSGDTKDASCSSPVDYGETPTTTPSQTEEDAANGGRRQSVLYQIFN